MSLCSVAPYLGSSAGKGTGKASKLVRRPRTTREQIEILPIRQTSIAPFGTSYAMSHARLIAVKRVLSLRPTT